MAQLFLLSLWWFLQFQIKVMGDDLSGAATSATVERQIRTIQKVIIHPNYDAATMTNDVAIMHVNISNIVASLLNERKFKNLEKSNKFYIFFLLV